MRNTRRQFVTKICAGLFGTIAFAAQSKEKRKPSLASPTPEDATEIAASAVSLVRKVDGVELDYSRASLAHIDRIVLSFRDGGVKPETVSGTLVVFGCYVGEVLVRGLGGRWDMPSPKEQQVGFSIVGVRTKVGGFWNPIGKVFKLMENGKEDSVEYLYTVVAERDR